MLTIEARLECQAREAEVFGRQDLAADYRRAVAALRVKAQLVEALHLLLDSGQSLTHNNRKAVEAALKAAKETP